MKKNELLDLLEFMSKLQNKKSLDENLKLEIQRYIEKLKFAIDHHDKISVKSVIETVVGTTGILLKYLLSP